MICDAHNDVLTCLSDRGFIEEYLIDCAQNGVRVITLALWSTTKKDIGAAALEIFDHFLPSYKEMSVRFALEDLDFLTLKELEELKKPIVYAGLTWNYDNRYAGGALSKEGLTREGAHAIEILSQKGIALDVAHLNRRSFFMALEACSAKILCSHACFDEVLPHPRNLNFEQIGEIVGRKGFVGLTFVPEFLCRGIAKTDDIVRHIDYFAERFGVDNLGIGSDFFGSNNLPEGILDYKNLSLISDALATRGYCQEDIDKIMYKNYLDWLK